jgi:uridine phosphorylase
VLGTTVHLHPTAPLAARALLPGDPGRALALAQELLVSPRMFNHNRGLWGYTGDARDGAPLTIQSTGLGGPSGAIVLEELIALGLRRAVRVGTCRALSPALAPGDLVLAQAAVATDGASLALGANACEPCDETIGAALERAAAERPPSKDRTLHRGTILTTDLFYDERGPGGHTSADAGAALAVELSTAALFTVARRRGVAVGCLLAVCLRAHAAPHEQHLDGEALLRAVVEMGELATAALAP